jgi:murein DD-endopeptidase MepM/ murein hydrolase activator NlpD
MSDKTSIFRYKIRTSMRRRKILKWILLILALIITGVAVYFSLGTKVTNNLDTYVYALPYKEGAKYKVVQGYGGMFSHKYKAALDFGMPVGTPIYAAREGVIHGYRENSDEGGPFPKYQSKSNYIVIMHNDGSFSCYWHLQKNGVVIKKGKVNKGQLIGYSGNTGFVLRPHLHFAVKRKFNYEKDSFVRTKFKTTKGVLLLEKGEYYQKPVN